VLASLKFFGRPYKAGYLVPEPGKVALVPRQENVCARLDPATGNQGVIDGSADDGRRHCFDCRDLFSLGEGNRGHSIPNLLEDVDAFCGGDTGSQR
jgi:hypothetical protein